MGEDEAQQVRIHNRLLVAATALAKLGDPRCPSPPATLDEAKAIARHALKLMKLGEGWKPLPEPLRG
jgi:hypothetical protein